MLPSSTNNTLLLSREKVSERTRENIKHSISANTKKSYKADLKHFRKWLDESARVFSLPISPGTIADYISDLDKLDFALSTIERRLNAISWLHRVNEVNQESSRVVSMTFQGIKRTRADTGKKTASTSKRPLMVNELKTLVSLIDTGKLSGNRDKALLLVGFASALRRSELVSLRVEDIRITGPGADITIRRSKTDQTGEGQTISIVRGSPGLCPVMALVDWYRVAGITTGSVFVRVRMGERITREAITGKTYANTIKKYCELAGLDPREYSGHSTRSGMLTSAAENGADLIPLAQHARHKTTNQTMHYIRQANRYKNNPTQGLL